MIILFIHASNFEFNVKERAIESAEEPKISSLKVENALVCFTTVEKGDDSETVKLAVRNILDVLEKVKAESVVIYPYAHLSSNLAEPKVAINLLEELESSLNVKTFRAPFGWYKAFSISCYGHPLSELSRRIRKLEEVEKSEELKYCEKFGFPNSAEATFMKRAMISYLRNTFKPIYEVENEEDVEEAVMSVTYKYLEAGRVLPCINENPRLLVIYGSVKELDFPKEFKDSKNSIRIWWVDKNKTYVDVSRLIYYIILDSVNKTQPPTLPDWLSPIHVRILPVKKDFLNYAINLAERLSAKGIRVDVDDLDDSLGNKIRRAGTEWIPYTVILGEREVKTNSLTVKIRIKNEQKSMTEEELVREIRDEVKERQNVPLLYSKRGKIIGSGRG